MSADETRGRKKASGSTGAALKPIAPSLRELVGSTAQVLQRPSAPQKRVVKKAGLKALTRQQLIADIRSMSKSVQANFYALGRALYEVNADDPREFKDVCDSVGLGYRKAMYLISVYKTAIEVGIPEEELVTVGWTKASLLASVLRPSNWRMWFNRARKMNTVTLQQYVSTGTADKRKLLALPVREDTHRAVMELLKDMGARHSARAGQWDNLDVVLMRVVHTARKTI